MGPSFDEWVDWATSQPLSPAQLEYIRKTNPAFYYNHIKMGKQPMTDKKRIRLEDVTRRGPYVPWLEGRPERSTVIGPEDVTNLLIALNTARDLFSFLAVV